MIDWNQIDRVLLDMDGTLLDLYFDNHFWLEYVPGRYAEVHGLSFEEAQTELLGRYKRAEGSLEWYCVDHWSHKLGLDIALLKQEVDHLIAVHPHVLEFLDRLREQGIRRVLVTNAHQKSLALKLERTRLGDHLDRVICAHDIGLAKENPGFWDKVRAIEPFDPARTLFVDDNKEVLAAARDYGIRWVIGVRKPDTRAPAKEMGDFQAIDDFSELL